MKKLKKLTALVLVMALISSFSAFAEDKDVEISFKVGESTLLVNGSELTVETPYVAGEGVTLVPLRVITEAFGAEVTWDGETKSIALKYPGVDILLTIGSKIAEVNKKAETLLEAPALSESGVTMVPLRFISETFGAEVSYDDKTGAIKVTLRKKTDGGKTVAGAVTEDFIGDSYYGWTIENPKDMTMTDRNFDGSYTEFSKDDNNWFFISIDIIPEDFSFDQYFAEVKNDFSGTTLVKADKGESDGVRTMHFQRRNKEAFEDNLFFVTDKYIYEVYGCFENGNEEIKNEGIRLCETFKLAFSKDGTYDLSTVVDGMRPFKSDMIALEMNIPADYYIYNEDACIDTYSFDKNTGNSMIYISVVSKSDVKSAEAAANANRKDSFDMLNPSLVKVSEPLWCQFPGFAGYYYTWTIKGSVNWDGNVKNVFFENGDYVYSISVVFVSEDDRDNKELIDKIINSVKVSEPDSSKLGTILSNTQDRSQMKTVKTANFSAEMPVTFEETYMSGADSSYYTDSTCGIMIGYNKTYADVSTKKKDINERLIALQDRSKQKKEEIIKEISDIKLGDKNLYTYYVAKATKEDSGYYIAAYAKLNQNSLEFITVVYPELFYSESNIKMVEAILASLETK